MVKVGNLSPFSGATAVQSRPKYRTSTVNLPVFAPPSQDSSQKPRKGLFGALKLCNSHPQLLAILID